MFKSKKVFQNNNNVLEVFLKHGVVMCNVIQLGLASRYTIATGLACTMIILQQQHHNNKQRSSIILVSIVSISNK